MKKTILAILSILVFAFNSINVLATGSFEYTTQAIGDVSHFAYFNNHFVFADKKQILETSDFKHLNTVYVLGENENIRYLYKEENEFIAVITQHIETQIGNVSYYILKSKNGIEWEKSEVIKKRIGKIKKLSGTNNIVVYINDYPYSTTNFENFDELDLQKSYELDDLYYEESRDGILYRTIDYDNGKIYVNGHSIIISDFSGSAQNYILSEGDNTIDNYTELTDYGHIIEIDNNKYVINRRLPETVNSNHIVKSASTVKYSDLNYNYFGSMAERGVPIQDYINADGLVLARDAINYDGNNPQTANNYNKAYFYNENCDLIHTQEFDGGVTDIRYANNNFYVCVTHFGNRDSNGQFYEDSQWYISSDMYQWDKTGEESIPCWPSDYNVGRSYCDRDGNYHIDLDENKSYIIKYENKLCDGNIPMGGYRIQLTDDIFLISKDGVYFDKYSLPAQFKLSSKVAFSDRKDFFEIHTPISILRTPKEVMYSNVNAMDAPYVVVNDELLAFENPPVIEDGSTLVPMRFLFEQMGADVDWNGATRTATATLDDTAVTFSIDNTQATVNKALAKMAVPARLIDDKTMVPLRFLSEELGFTVTWDADTRTAIIEQ